jgi:hypothetical protein
MIRGHKQIDSTWMARQRDTPIQQTSIQTSITNKKLQLTPTQTMQTVQQEIGIGSPSDDPDSKTLWLPSYGASVGNHHCA